MANTGPNGNLGHDQAGDMTRQLQNLPGFNDALAGRINAGQFPTGPDGLVVPNFREANARYFASQHGIDLGSGSHIDNGGKVHAVNDQPWYTDPRWLGPITVGGLSLGAGAFGGAGGGAGAASGAATGAESGSYIGADVASTASAASGGHGILGTAANVLLGRGTGNTALDTAGRVGRGLLGIEADRQAGRESEAQATQAQDRNAIAAANVNLTAGSRRGAQSVQGDVMANAQPFKWTGDNQMVGNIPVPQFSGGVSPALFSDNTRKLGGELSADALASQTADHGSPVNLTPLPQGSATDSILSTAGRIGGLLSMIPYKRPQAPVPTGWA